MSDYANLTDRQPVPGARFTDLDLSQVQRHIAVAKERSRYDGSGVVDLDGVPVLSPGTSRTAPSMYVALARISTHGRRCSD
jgi:hypothetical protein